MTQKEAIAEIERLLDCAKKLQGPQTFVDFRPVPALEMALAALRLVSREQVEALRGEWVDKPTGSYGRWQTWCSACGKHSGIGGIKSNRHSSFCPNCGAPMTDEAVEMVMERLEAFYE